MFNEEEKYWNKVKRIIFNKWTFITIRKGNPLRLDGRLDGTQDFRIAKGISLYINQTIHIQDDVFIIERIGAVKV